MNRRIPNKMEQNSVELSLNNGIINNQSNWSRCNSFSSSSSDSTLYCSNSPQRSSFSGRKRLKNDEPIAKMVKRSRNSSGSSASSNLSCVSDKDINRMPALISSEQVSHDINSIETLANISPSTLAIQHEALLNNRLSHPLDMTASLPFRHNLRRNIRRKTCSCDCTTTCTTVVVSRQYKGVGEQTVEEKTVISSTKVKTCVESNTAPTRQVQMSSNVSMHEKDRKNECSFQENVTHKNESNKKQRTEMEGLYDSLNEMKWAKTVRQFDINNAAQTPIRQVKVSSKVSFKKTHENECSFQENVTNENKCSFKEHVTPKNECNRKRRSEMERLYDSLHEIKWAKNFSPDNILQQFDIRQAASCSAFGKASSEKHAKTDNKTKECSEAIKIKTPKKSSDNIKVNKYNSYATQTRSRSSLRSCENRFHEDGSSPPVLEKSIITADEALNIDSPHYNTYPHLSKEVLTPENEISTENNVDFPSSCKTIETSCPTYSDFPKSILNFDLNSDCNINCQTNITDCSSTFFDITENNIHTIDACFREVGAEVVVSTCCDMECNNLPLLTAVKEFRSSDLKSISNDCPPVLEPLLQECDASFGFSHGNTSNISKFEDSQSLQPFKKFFPQVNPQSISLEDYSLSFSFLVDCKKNNAVENNDENNCDAEDNNEKNYAVEDNDEKNCAAEVNDEKSYAAEVNDENSYAAEVNDEKSYAAEHSIMNYAAGAKKSCIKKRRKEIDRLYESMKEFKWAKNFSPIKFDVNNSAQRPIRKVKLSSKISFQENVTHGNECQFQEIVSHENECSFQENVTQQKSYAVQDNDEKTYSLRSFCDTNSEGIADNDLGINSNLPSLMSADETKTLDQNIIFEPSPPFLEPCISNEVCYVNIKSEISITENIKKKKTNNSLSDVNDKKNCMPNRTNNFSIKSKNISQICKSVEARLRSKSFIISSGRRILKKYMRFINSKSKKQNKLFPLCNKSVKSSVCQKVSPISNTFCNTISLPTNDNSSSSIIPLSHTNCVQTTPIEIINSSMLSHSSPSQISKKCISSNELCVKSAGTVISAKSATVIQSFNQKLSFSKLSLIQTDKKPCLNNKKAKKSSLNNIFSNHYSENFADIPGYSKILSAAKKKEGHSEKKVDIPPRVFTCHFQTLNVTRGNDYIQIVLKITRGKSIFLTHETLVELKEAVIKAGNDKDCRLLILNGFGQTFCLGLDLRPLVGDHKNQAVGEIAQAVKDLIGTLADFQKPLVAIVNGAAFGLGLTILNHADVTLATSNASFCMPYSRLGYMPEGGATLTLPQAVGTTVAMDLILRGQVITAEQARDIGLVNEVVEVRHLPQDLVSRVKAIAENSLPGMEATKAMIKMRLHIQLPLILETEAKLLPQMWLSPSCQEAIQSVLDSRFFEDC